MGCNARQSSASDGEVSCGNQLLPGIVTRRVLCMTDVRVQEMQISGNRHSHSVDSKINIGLRFDSTPCPLLPATSTNLESAPPGYPGAPCPGNCIIATLISSSFYVSFAVSPIVFAAMCARGSDFLHRCSDLTMMWMSFVDASIITICYNTTACVYGNLV